MKKRMMSMMVFAGLSLATNNLCADMARCPSPPGLLAMRTVTASGRLECCITEVLGRPTSILALQGRHTVRRLEFVSDGGGYFWLPIPIVTESGEVITADNLIGKRVDLKAMVLTRPAKDGGSSGIVSVRSVIRMKESIKPAPKPIPSARPALPACRSR